MTPCHQQFSSVTSVSYFTSEMDSSGLLGSLHLTLPWELDANLKVLHRTNNQYKELNTYIVRSTTLWVVVLCFVAKSYIFVYTCCIINIYLTVIGLTHNHKIMPYTLTNLAYLDTVYVSVSSLFLALFVLMCPCSN